jgi:thiamine pyrophosphokinase
VTYGTSSAPFLATRCLKKLADDNEQQYSRAAHVLKNDFYLDDLLSGTSTIEEAIDIQKELSSLLQTAGLTLRKWASNYSTFLDAIPRELQETQTTLSLDNTDGVTTLGLRWNPKNDKLQVRSSLTHKNLQTPTSLLNVRC